MKQTIELKKDGEVKRTGSEKLAEILIGEGWKKTAIEIQKPKTPEPKFPFSLFRRS